MLSLTKDGKPRCQKNLIFDEVEDLDIIATGGQCWLEEGHKSKHRAVVIWND